MASVLQQPRQVMMRLLDRNDTSLATGLVVAAIVVFHRPLRAVLDFTHEIESYYHLDLVPALVVLCFAFALHQSRRRHAARQEARIAAAAARHQAERVRDLETLVTFGRAAARVQDSQALEQVVWCDLATALGGRAHFVAIGHRHHLRVLAGSDILDRVTERRIEAYAEQVLAGGTAVADVEAAPLDRFVPVPLMAGHETLGVLGLDDRGFDERARQAAGAIASILAIAVRNVRAMDETRQKSVRDSLTRAYNRAYATEALSRELQRSRRTARPPSIMMLDVDAFKAVNDRHGHLAGDRLLIAIADRLHDLLRGTDIVCRYGGDEFLVVLPDTPLRIAEQLARRVREEVATVRIAHDEVEVLATVSVGVTAALPGEIDAETVIERADRGMYHAKQAGRNECNTVTPTTPAVLIRGFLDTFPPSETRPADRPASEPAPRPHAPIEPTMVEA